MTTPDLSDPELMNHVKAVQNGSEEWCVFGYVPKSNTKIRFCESGTSGGLTALREELSDSSIRYAYIRFQINNMAKFCYIAWCGDGVNGPIKGSFSGHAIEIAKILKPLHHQLNARNEDDLDEKRIIAALTKATGASYDSGAKIQGTTKPAVPTSVAQGRVQATQSSIQPKSFDKSDYTKKDESALYWQQTNAQTSTTDHKAKPDRSEYNINSSEKEKYWSQANQQPEPAAPKPTTSAPSRTVASRFQEAAAQPSNPVKPPPPRSTGNVTSRFQQMKVHEPEPEPEPAYEEPQHTYEEPQQTYEEPEQHYEEQHYEEPQQHYEEPQQTYEEQHYEEPQQHYEEPQQTYEEQHYEEPQQHYQEQSGYVQVKALYDYAGENDGDLSFNAGDIINVMDQSDPAGWWQGELNGATGYFPMNFVEQI